MMKLKTFSNQKLLAASNKVEKSRAIDFITILVTIATKAIIMILRTLSLKK